MSSALVSRSLPVAGGALVALAGIFALNQGQARDASRLTAELAQASDHLVALDYRLRHPDLVAAEERRKRVSAQQGRIRLLTPLRDQPTVSEEITARFSVRSVFEEGQNYGEGGAVFNHRPDVYANVRRSGRLTP